MPKRFQPARRTSPATEESDGWRPVDEVVAAREGYAPRTAATISLLRQWRGYLELHGARYAIGGLAIAFVLLIASQWLPWASVGAAGVGHNFDVDVGIDNGSTILVLTYYLMWTLVLALAGATVFAPRRVRQPLFGASIGAIVAQFVAILPLVRHPKGLVGSDVASLPQFGNATELLVTRQAGMFCAVFALFVLGAAMVAAVEGNVMPPSMTDRTEADHDEAVVAVLTVDPPATPDDAAGRHTAREPDSVAPTSPVPLAIDALHVENVEALPEPGAEDVGARADRVESDHSPYIRPLTNEQYRR
ncbi:MAG TPA: hypothetical protein VH442_03275 [Micromonosporaceae bacterium]|jgi:hypothetical protein